MSTATKLLQPNQIDLSSGLCNIFGKSEVEQAAVELIQYLIHRGNGWTRFKLDDYFSWRYRNVADNIPICKYPLFGLLGAWYDDGGAMGLIKDQQWLINVGTQIHIQPEFIQRVSDQRTHFYFEQS